MPTSRRGFAAAIAAVAVSLSLTATAQAEAPVQALSPWDAQIYAAAFEAARTGDYAQAAEKVASAGDKSLAGHVEFLRIMSADGPRVSYDELAAWLASYADHPGAERVHALALKRRPAGAAEPRAPELPQRQALPQTPRSYASLTATPSADEAVRSTPVTAEGRAAREAYYSGDPRTAFALATAARERWVAGLAAFRLGDHAEALSRFESLANDPGEGAWIRSGAAYWASRAAIAGGSPELAPDFLRLAARSPNTFYGQIAERQLGLESDVSGEDATPSFREIAERFDPVRRVAGVDQIALAGFIRSNARAKRAVALAQLGLAEQAGAELRAGYLTASADDDRRRWTTLAQAVGEDLPASAGGDIRTVKGAAPADFPTPRLAPKGGWSLPRSLVYAIVKQESRFKPDAGSHAGARGLMQLMPRTAAYIARKVSGTASDDRALRDPATNLRLGQDYFTYLLDNGSPQGDLLRSVAAYNGGQGAVMRAVETVGSDHDPLMLIESLPAQETRDYVEKVVAGYWVYRRIFGETIGGTLDAVASGRRSAELALDR